MLTLHNLSGEPRTASVEAALGPGDGLHEVFGDRQQPAAADERSIDLGRYGYRWFRITG